MRMWRPNRSRRQLWYAHSSDGAEKVSQSWCDSSDAADMPTQSVGE